MGRETYYLEAKDNDNNRNHVVVKVRADSSGQAVKKARSVIAKRIRTDNYTILSVHAEGSRGYGS